MTHHEHVIQIIIRYWGAETHQCSLEQWRAAWTAWDAELNDTVVRLGDQHRLTREIELMPRPPGVTYSVRRGR